MKRFYSILIIVALSSLRLWAGNVDDIAQKYFELAKQNNSGIKTAYNNWQAEVEKVGYADKLPNPRLSFGYFLNNVETAVGPQEYKLGFYQSLPWYGKLSIARKIQIQQAEIQKLQIEKQLENIFLQIQITLYNVYFINQQIVISDENLNLLRQWQQILEVKYQSSSVSFTNLIKVQQEIFQREQEISSLKNQLEKLLISLETLTETEISDDELANLKIDTDFSKMNIDSLRTNLMQNNTDLQILRTQKEIANLMTSRAKQDYIPNAGIGLDYIVTGDKYLANGDKVSDSGKDPLMISMSLEIPLQFRKISKKIKASEYSIATVTDLEKEMQKNLFAELDKLMLDSDDLKKNFWVYDQKIIPTTEQSLNIQTVELQTDRVDIYQLIVSQRDLLKSQLKCAKILTDYHINEAKILQLSGVY